MHAETLHHDEPVMGTVVSFDIYPSALSRVDEVLALSRARRTLHLADAVFSTYREHSPMSRLRRGDISLEEVPSEISEVLEICERVRDLTEGWFDPWVIPGGVDPTGVVKGWAAERALAELELAGVTTASVNAGGDIVTAGLPPSGTWRFGIQDPFRTDQLAAVVEVERAIATSGTYARGAHLFDPHTHRSVLGVASATVIGEDLAVADGIATALAVAGAPLLGRVASAGYSGFVIAPGGERYATPDFPFVDAGDHPPTIN